MNIGLFDMDGSLADYEQKLKDDLFLTMSPDEIKNDSNKNIWDLDELYYYKQRIRTIKSQPNWWLNLPIMVNGFAILNMAREIGFDIHILTKGPKWYPTAWKEKIEWCQNYLGKDIDVHITSDKGLVYGKFLYDDYPEYMLKWLAYRPRGLGIMPVNNNNKDFEHPQVIKWDGSNECFHKIKEALVECFNRKVGKCQC